MWRPKAISVGAIRGGDKDAIRPKFASATAAASAAAEASVDVESRVGSSLSRAATAASTLSDTHRRASFTDSGVVTAGGTAAEG